MNANELKCVSIQSRRVRGYLYLKLRLTRTNVSQFGSFLSNGNDYMMSGVMSEDEPSSITEDL